MTEAVVHLDVHPVHTTAITATLEGHATTAARATLAAHSFKPLDERTMIVARIDCEEAHYAEKAASALRAADIHVTITQAVQAAIDEDWTWVNYPLHWLTRDEMRRVSDDAQEIHDDIAAGRLRIHAHARDAHTTVAVGTYIDGSPTDIHLRGKSVHLHGEDHLRLVSGVYDTPHEALKEFFALHSAQSIPGPAPLTDRERWAASVLGRSAKPSAAGTDPTPSAQARREGHITEGESEASRPVHEVLLNDFFDQYDDWERYRTGPDETTVASRECLTVRIEFDHEADPGEPSWTIAAYASPVGEREWTATFTSTTPPQLVSSFLHDLADAARARPSYGAPLRPSSPFSDTELPQILDAADWRYTEASYRHAVWKAPDRRTRMSYDEIEPKGWTISGSADPRWTATFSPSTPRFLIHPLIEQLSTATSAPLRRAALHDRSAERARPSTSTAPSTQEARVAAGRSSLRQTARSMSDGAVSTPPGPSKR